MIFIYNITQLLDMDKKDIITLFQELRLYCHGDFCNNIDLLNIVETLFESYNISKLDIKRMYRYLDRTVKKETAILIEDYGDDID